MRECRRHTRPVFGCAECIAAAAPPRHVTMKGSVVDEPWVCPQCQHRNRPESLMCRRPLEGKKAPPRVIPRICGYDRRTGEPEEAR